MAAVAPFEIVVSPFTIYVAPVGTAFPVVDLATPAAPWQLVGKNGNKNMDESGVVLTHSQSIQQIRSYGTTGPIKATRNSEDLQIDFTLLDLRLEEYTRTINNAALTATAAASGIAGYQSIDLLRGQEVATVALLIRGASPYGVGASGGWNSQYNLRSVYQNGQPAVTLIKSDSAKLACSYMALADLTAAAGEEFGQLWQQDADALA